MLHHHHHYYGHVKHHHFTATHRSMGDPNNPNSDAYADNLNKAQGAANNPAAAPTPGTRDVPPDHMIDLLGNKPQVLYGKKGTPEADRPIGVVFADPATGRGYVMHGVPIMGQDGHTPVGVTSADPQGRMVPHYVSDALKSLHRQRPAAGFAPH